MSTWHEYVQRTGTLPAWPYPVDYSKVNEDAYDVIIIGGGVAGLRAAIAAAEAGVKVAVVERGHAKRSGAGGAGVDHWHGAVTNPCSSVTPQMYTDACYDSMRGWTGGHVRYVITSEGWDTLQESEEMGVQIRDVHDEFQGADFRDEETKLCFAYDYKNRHVVRVWGYDIKVRAYERCLKLGVKIYNRMMPTALLTEGGRQGGRVVGCTAVNTRTGEFYVIRSKATVICTGGAGGRLFDFSPEVTASSSMNNLNASGAGEALGWKAGAEFVCMEKTAAGRLSGYGYAPYSMGNAHNTFHGTPIVDADGKEVPWVDAFARPIEGTAARFLPCKDQAFILGEGIGISFYDPAYRNNMLAPDLPELVRKGVYKLPLYADFSRLSELERRNIFGMMVGNEGKTRIPIYETMTCGGFDPEKDLFQVPIMPPEGYNHSNFWAAGINTPPTIRSLSGGGFLVDWDFRTNLEGLYVGAGGNLFGGGCHGESHTTGRYAGRHAAAYARTAPEPKADPAQVKAEREAAYRNVDKPRSNNGWKEINSAIARIMRDYCGQYKNETTLTMGLRLLEELRTTELADAYASNPHELGRLLECYAIIEVAELALKASLERKSSNLMLDFRRIDYPATDEPAWNKLLPIKQLDGKVTVRSLPLDFHLQAPYAPTYEENYQAHK